MSIKGQDSKEQDGGGNGGTGAALPFWWLLLVLLAIFVPFTLLARVLHLTFDLPEHSIIVYPSGIIVACAVIFAEPRTFKQLGRVAAIAGGVGILAMLCLLPVDLLSQAFTISSRRLMLQVLGAMLIGWAETWVFLEAYRRLGVPLRKFDQDHR